MQYFKESNSPYYKYQIHTLVALGGLVVACLTVDPRFAGSNPAEDDGFFKGDKNP
jgi:hypothetical protein